MKVAKLSTDKVVLYLKEPSFVNFEEGLYVLVSNKLTTNPRQIDPYWVPATQVVRIMEF